MKETERRWRDSVNANNRRRAIMAGNQTGKEYSPFPLSWTEKWINQLKGLQRYVNSDHDFTAKQDNGTYVSWWDVEKIIKQAEEGA